MLEIRNLVKEFYQNGQDVAVVNGLDLHIKKGEVFGFLGPNGAGKTTTVKMITGLLKPTGGSIRIDGHLAGRLSAQRLIGFMSENPQFYQYLKAREVLEFVGELFGLDRSRIKTLAVDLLDQVGLTKAKELPTRQFSKGMFQRLAFAVALVNDPQLLILDEPLDGLDPIGRLDFKRLIRHWQKDGRTIFFSSHILSDVEELCDRVAILDRGQLLKVGKPGELTRGHQSLEEVFVSTVRSHV